MASVSSWVQAHLLSLHGPVVYLVVGGLVFFELGIVIGFFIPGEIATIVGGVLAGEHHANVVIVIVVVVVAASLGNWSGYEVGQWIGPWLLDHRPLKGNRDVVRAQRLLVRWGGAAVLVGRWVAVVRAILPALAGVSDMSRRVFVFFSVIGAAAWGTMWVLIGFVAGKNYNKIVNAAGRWSLVVVIVVAALLLVRWTLKARRWRNERHQRREQAATDAAGEPQDA